MVLHTFCTCTPGMLGGGAVPLLLLTLSLPPPLPSAEMLQRRHTHAYGINQSKYIPYHSVIGSPLVYNAADATVSDRPLQR